MANMIYFEKKWFCLERKTVFEEGWSEVDVYYSTHLLKDILYTKKMAKLKKTRV